MKYPLKKIKTKRDKDKINHVNLLLYNTNITRNVVFDFLLRVETA